MKCIIVESGGSTATGRDVLRWRGLALRIGRWNHRWYVPHVYVAWGDYIEVGALGLGLYFRRGRGLTLNLPMGFAVGIGKARYGREVPCE